MNIIKPNFLKGFWGHSKGKLGMVEAPGKVDSVTKVKRDL